MREGWDGVVVCDGPGSRDSLAHNIQKCWACMKDVGRLAQWQSETGRAHFS